MSEQIKDGKGRGFLAQVNEDQDLVTRSISVEQRLKSTLDGHYYEATTGKVTLANATETGLIYLKNTHTTMSMVIDRVFWDVWASTGGAGGGTLRYYKDVTVVGGTAITPNITLYGQPNAAQGTFLKSVTSLSGTEWWTGLLEASTSIALDEGRIVLPKNGTHLISVAAPAGNTSMDVSINVAFYYFNTDLV